MLPSGYSIRYLEHKEFLKLCNDLEINTLSAGADERWLELLEKEKILFPICRVKYPLSYLKKMFDIRYNPSNPYYSKATFCLPNRYEYIYKLKLMINNFWIDKRLSHVLDKLNDKFKKYVQIPEQSVFRKWKSYKKVVGKIQGYDQQESIAVHFYAYWQAYHFYEVTKACTLDYVINVFNEEIRGNLWHLKIPLKKIFSRSLPQKYDKIKGDYWGQTQNFETLSFYIQTVKKHKFLISQSKIYTKDSLQYLDEKSTAKYYYRLKTLTKVIVKKYNFTPTEAYNFLKFLCGRYEKYREKKKDKLAEFIKKDIYYLIQMMQNGFDLEFETINKNLGRVIRDYGNTLDAIFPPIFAKERENVLYNLNSFLSDNKNFYPYKDVVKKEIEAFLEFLDKNNLQLFYYSLGQINKTQLMDQTIYLHAFYLSLLLENVIKIISRKNSTLEFSSSLVKLKTLKPSLKEFFMSEKWQEVLFNKKDRWWEKYTEVNLSTDINLHLKTKIASFKVMKSEKLNQIMRMFLTCGFARNLSAHEHAKMFHIDREVYLTMVNTIVSAIWFTWKYAIKKKYILVH